MTKLFARLADKISGSPRVSDKIAMVEKIQEISGKNLSEKQIMKEVEDMMAQEVEGQAKVGADVLQEEKQLENVQSQYYKEQ